MKAQIRSVCKPCWELKYCPYGPLVEQFPLPRIERTAAAQHNEFLKRQLAAGAYDEDAKRRRYFELEVKKFDASEYPVKTSAEEKFVGCNIFGHVCPVFIVAEGFTETSEGRNLTRTIPFQVKMRVVRRDNYTCQQCGKH
jgi:hypothetical protein